MVDLTKTKSGEPTHRRLRDNPCDSLLPGGFCRWALTDSNRRPLPCKGRNAVGSYKAPSPNSFVGKGFMVLIVSNCYLLFRILLPTFYLLFRLPRQLRPRTWCIGVLPI